jgi:hypothetical protein
MRTTENVIVGKGEIIQLRLVRSQVWKPSFHSLMDGHVAAAGYLGV